ncbi:MAG: YbhB/YbcL family Raf kinase inhibitor-like protein [Rhodocyclaceae bacterium]|nr:YbhB/YbcL family Raf kinase inhibitor-like protein [Rhodocyclaceae bacterium]
MKLTSQSFADNAPIPGEFAFAIPAAEGHVTLSGNRNPHLAWTDVPAGTRSLALICHDPDVPSRSDDVNQEGRIVPASLPRVDFFHWVLANLSPEVREIAAGSFCEGVTARGKTGPQGPLGTLQGINDYTGWFAGDDQMKGNYFGYDGPCPPWNDALPHHYVFTLYALDVAALALDSAFTGQQLRQAIAGHVLGEARLTGRYTLNPDVTL